MYLLKTESLCTRHRPRSFFRGETRSSLSFVVRLGRIKVSRIHIELVFVTTRIRFLNRITWIGGTNRLRFQHSLKVDDTVNALNLTNIVYTFTHYFFTNFSNFLEKINIPNNLHFFLKLLTFHRINTFHQNFRRFIIIFFFGKFFIFSQKRNIPIKLHFFCNFQFSWLFHISPTFYFCIFFIFFENVIFFIEQYFFLKFLIIHCFFPFYRHFRQIFKILLFMTIFHIFLKT